MLLQRAQRLDAARVREVIRAHPWAVLVTHAAGGMLASHMPALLDEAATDELAVLTHVAAADPQRPRLEGGGELLIVFQGVNGFLPGAWEGGDGAAIGTWNFEAVHVHGVPEVLDRPRSLALLRRTFG